MRRWREPVFVVLLYLSVATALGFVDYAVRPESNQDRGFKYSEDVCAGRGEAPGRYRVLAPCMFQGLRRLMPSAQPRNATILFRWLGIAFALAAAHFYFRGWFKTPIAVSGTLMMAVLVPLTFTDGWAHPDQFVEWCLFTLACAFIARGSDWLFALALVANAFNRETSVFLLPLFLLAKPFSGPRLIRTAVFAAMWAAVYAGLRWKLGLQLYDPWQVRQNVTYMFASGFTDVWAWYHRWAYAWFGVVMIAPLVWITASSWPDLPRFARVAAGIVAPAFLVTAFLFSSMIEVRMMTPLLPLLMPSALFGLFGPGARAADARAGA